MQDPPYIFFRNTPTCATHVRDHEKAFLTPTALSTSLEWAMQLVIGYSSPLNESASHSHVYVRVKCIKCIEWKPTGRNTDELEHSKVTACSSSASVFFTAALMTPLTGFTEHNLQQ